MLLLVKDPVALQATGRHPGELVPMEIQCSNWTFGGDPSWAGHSVQLSWAASIIAGSSGRRQRLGNATIPIGHDASIAQGDTGPIAAFGVVIPQAVANEASRIVVEVELRIGATTVAMNHWNLTVFPEPLAAQTNCSVPVYADASLLHAARQICSNAALAPPSLAPRPSSGPFVLVQRGGLSAENAAALTQSAGGVVLLLNPADGWPACTQSALGQVTVQKMRYSQPWWMDPGFSGTFDQ